MGKLLQRNAFRNKSPFHCPRGVGGKVFATALIGILLISELVAAAPGRVEVRMAQQSVGSPEEGSSAAAERAFQEGMQLYRQGTAESLQQAIQKWEEALPLFRAVGDQLWEGATLLGIGKVYDDLGEKQKALDYYNQSLSLSQQVGDKGAEATILNNIGNVYDALGEKQKALDYYNQSLSLSRQVGNKVGEARTLTGIGLVYSDLGEKQKALDYYNQSLSLSRQVGDKAAEARTISNIGSVYSDLGEKQKALDYYNQSLPLLQQVGDKAGEARTLNKIGLVYSDLGEKQKALDYYNQSLRLSRQAGDKEGEAATLSSIGGVYNDLGENQKALEYYNQSLPLRRQVGDKEGEAVTINNIGLVYSDLGEKQKALEYYNQSLPLRRQVGDKAGEAITLSNIGKVYSDLGEKQKALDYFNQSLPLLRQVGDKAGEATSLNNIGAVYSDLGENQKALDYYNQSLPLTRQVGDKAQEAITLYNFAYLERDRGNLNEALTNIESAIKIIEELRLKIGSQQLRASYFASVQNQGYYEFYIDLLMQLHKANLSQGYDAKALHASERSKARSLLELLTEANANIRQGVDPKLLEQERNLQQQLNAAEQSRVKLLQGQYTNKELDNIKQQIEDTITQLQRVEGEIRLNSPRYASLNYPQPLTLSEIQQQVLDDNTILLEYSLGEERSYLWAVTKTGLTAYELPKRTDIEAAAKAFYQQLKSPAMTSVEDGMKLSQILLSPVANQLGNKRLLIVGDGALQYIPFAALPIPANAKMSVSQLARPEINNTVGELTAGADPSPTPPLQGEGLSSFSDPPFPGREGGVRFSEFANSTINFRRHSESPLKRTNSLVLTVGFNRLKLLAWDLNPRRIADTNPSNSYTPLLVQNEIVTLPSASTIAILRKDVANRTPAPKALAVIADPVFNRNDPRLQSKSAQTSNAADSTTLTRSITDIGIILDRLQYTRQEAEAILALVPENQRTSAFDFSASRPTATDSNLSQYRIVHLATHGLVNSVRPELSGVVLSLVNQKGEDEDGFLRLGDIFNLNLPAELVVLSACETGLGKDIKGEGLIGLTRGFMYAGAKDVAVSLWSVNDVGTSELMKRFYQQMLEKKLNPVAAMRAAQLEMMQSEQWKAPYYWAAFVVQGEWK